MGIKFLCPNGHKLHVKAFLAGRKAICPKCGARVVVPDETALPDEKGLPEESAALSDAENSLHELEPAVATAEGGLDALLVDDALGAHDAPELTAGLESETSGAAQPPPLSSDPIAEAPGAVWYVRPATGGQYGPASAEIMRSWLEQGRVSASSLVWRAPWPEWRSASATFPQLGPAPAGTLPRPPLPANGNPPAEMSLGQAVSTVDAGPPEVETLPTMAPLTQAVRKRRRKHDASLIFSAILLAVSLILVIVLWLVWPSQTSDSEPEPQGPPPAADDPLI